MITFSMEKNEQKTSIFLCKIFFAIQCFNIFHQFCKHNRGEILIKTSLSFLFTFPAFDMDCLIPFASSSFSSKQTNRKNIDCLYRVVFWFLAFKYLYLQGILKHEDYHCFNVPAHPNLAIPVLAGLWRTKFWFALLNYFYSLLLRTNFCFTDLNNRKSFGLEGFYSVYGHFLSLILVFSAAMGMFWEALLVSDIHAVFAANGAAALICSDSHRNGVFMQHLLITVTSKCCHQQIFSSQTSGLESSRVCLKRKTEQSCSSVDRKWFGYYQIVPLVICW